jgi:histidine triad (HIT) family protein
MYNHAPDNYRCPFCLLVQGVENKDVLSVQSDIVHHDDQLTAFVSLHQWANNHANVIIVPNAHFENIYDLPVHYAADIHQLARNIALAMKAIYSCDGISTRQHNEPAGNQDVWHYHMHVTPRYKDDQYYSTRPEPMAVSERARHAERLKGYLEKHPVYAMKVKNR